MSKLTDAVAEYVEKTHHNILYFTDITDGVSETIHFGKSNPCQDSYSVAKAFTVTAIGILYDKGLLTLDIFVFLLPLGRIYVLSRHGERA